MLISPCCTEPPSAIERAHAVDERGRELEPDRRHHLGLGSTASRASEVGGNLDAERRWSRIWISPSANRGGPAIAAAALTRRDDDLAPFAALNDDLRVMEFVPSVRSRAFKE